MSRLDLIVLLPVLGAIAIVLGGPARKQALAVAAINLLLCLSAFLSYDYAQSGFQFLTKIPVMPEWDLKYFTGADGLSLVMVLLTTLVTLCAIWVTPPIENSERWFHACVLLISAGALGAFLSLDLFFFYAFHELALIPTFLMIGIWGSGNRQAAAWKITIYLAVGSFVLLLGLIGLYQSFPESARTFDIPALQQLAKSQPIAVSSQSWIYLLLLIGFGILISLFPFHTWAPQAYASAPTPAAMLHAGVLKKFGLYGLLRVAVPMLPQGAQHWTDLLLLLLVGNIIYVGLVTIAQKRLDMMLGYSSVMHMGYAFLGIASLNAIGMNGAALLMFAHGLSIAVLFAIAGELRQRTETLQFSDLGGLARTMPFLGLCFGLGAFASIGLPGFANFPSELMVFFGAFNNSSGTSGFNHYQWAATFALWGVVISAVYMLRAYRIVFMGEPRKRWAQLIDAQQGRRWPLMLLIAGLLIAGFCPQLFRDLIGPSLHPLFPLK